MRTPFRLRDRWQRAKRLVKANPMKLLVASPPKTGNVWVKQLLAETYGLRVLRPAPAAADEAFEELVRQGRFPNGSIFHQHYPPTRPVLATVEASGCRVVTVLRNPYDTFVSLYHFVQNVPENFQQGHPLSFMVGKRIDDPEVLAFLQDARRGFGRRLRLGEEWLDSGRSLVTRYEDLERDTEAELVRLTDALEPVSRRTVERAVRASSAEQMRKRDPSVRQHIRVAVVGDFRNHLRDCHFEIFRQQYGELITKLGYRVV